MEERKANMATGKKVKDIFQSTTHKSGAGVEVVPQFKGRPQAVEPYKKVTVCLFNSHTLFLDKISLVIQEKTGQHIPRAELIRAIVDHATTWIDPKREDFDKTIQSLLPNLKRR
jgi:hypothetical protein